MSALDKKLIRDLGDLKGQVLTIALVVACGVASYVTLQSTWASLHASKDAYYARYRMGDVFAVLRRAPEPVKAQLEAIPGVSRVYTRVVEDILLPVEGLAEPAAGRLVSLPLPLEPSLNGLYLRSGRMPIAGRADEVVVNTPFADAHGLTPGGRLPAVINGVRRDLRVVGTGMSPEYIFPIRPGDVSSDDKRLAVLWMDRAIMAPAFRMEGAFNDVTLRLQPDVTPVAVASAVDRVLDRYGGIGAIARDKQLSNFILENEMAGLESFATVVPFIFLAVATFLLNVVLSRLVSLQRQQIAIFKALGYSNRQVALHYVKLVSAIVGLGAALGLAVGAWFGSSLTALYSKFFRFPVLTYRLDSAVIMAAVGISLLGAFVGALLAFRQVVRLPPAEAMRPPAPTAYRRSALRWSGLRALFGEASMMAVREVTRRPLRAALSSVGIAASIGIVIVGLFSADSVDHLMNHIFHRGQPGDITVAFTEPVEAGAVRELEHLPGVLDAEGQRSIAVRFRAGHRWRDSVINGYERQPRLRRIVDRDAEIIPPPAGGISLSRKLAEILGASVGDTVEVEVREGKRPHRTIAVAGLIDDSFGLQGYTTLDALHELLDEPTRFTTIELAIDTARTDELLDRLKELPRVAAVTRRQAVVDNFNEQTGGYMRVMSLVLSLFGITIAVGVVYNNARVALSMRSRDLASLRVLGFTRREVSVVLLSEVLSHVIVAIPLGLLMGTWWANAVMSAQDPEFYRMPAFIARSSYAFAALIGAGAGVLSALLVRRKLDHLDLIAVLKTRE